MLRDIVLSVTGHVVICGGLIYSSVTADKPPELTTVYKVQAVALRQIEQLPAKQTQPEERTSKVPQVQVKRDEQIPKQTRRRKQTAKQTASQQAQQGKGKKGSKIKGIQTDTEFDYPDYLIEMRDRIYKNWKYPQLRESLMATVYFRISKDGRILVIQIKKKTGNVRFDRSAWTAVQKSNPFSPLPEDFTEQELGVHFNFYYDHNL